MVRRKGLFVDSNEWLYVWMVNRAPHQGLSCEILYNRESGASNKRTFMLTERASRSLGVIENVLSRFNATAWPL